MKVIIYKTQKNGVAILYPASSWEGNLEEMAAKDVPQNTPWKSINVSEIPSDRTFRNAWEWKD